MYINFIIDSSPESNTKDLFYEEILATADERKNSNGYDVKVYHCCNKLDLA
jgi:hypothetical protein